MKAFEKWLQTQLPYDPFCCGPMAKEAWRAALEWANSKDTDSCSEGFACYLQMLIDEELEDGEAK